jgi:CDP-ribitol ribitolphosphotransferase
MHPFIKEKYEIPQEYKTIIFDYYDYDINELIYISDVMITDYSSCAYEFSFFNRPLIFFRYDKEIYEYERPVHTLDAFTEQQYEVKTSQELITRL